MLLNTVNGNCYVGSTNCTRTRTMAHRRELRKGTHGNLHLQGAWNIYGEKHFQFILLEKCHNDPLILISREQHYIDTTKSEYNICKRADMSQHSPESKEKIRVALTGKKKSISHRMAMSSSRVGRPSGRKGKKYDISDELRFRIGANWRGKTLPNEVKQKMSQTRKGRKPSEEHKRRISESIKEKHANPTPAMLAGYIKGGPKKREWKWVTNGVHSKRIHISKVNDLEPGYIFGRVIGKRLTK